MPPLTSWSDLADASVGLWGLGVEGTANLHRLQAMGVTPRLVDDAPKSDHYEGLDVLTTGQGGLAALLECDVVVKSPGISRYRPEVAAIEGAGIPVRGGLGLWLEEAARDRVVCITGTKGKSTTAALTSHLLTNFGYDARIGGNFGQPPWDPALRHEPDYWIVETSSFQVPDLTIGPEIVAVTSLFPDHLDWHGDVEHYYDDKLSLCTKPGVRVALIDGADERLRDRAALLGTAVQWVTLEPVADGWARGLHLPGVHNLRNAIMARAMLVALGIEEANDDDQMESAIGNFVGLPSRCHSLGYFGGVEFVDDSLSTNVLPAQAALSAFPDRPVALLVGGHDRGIDYTPLGTATADRLSPTLVVTMPDNGPRIGQAIRQWGGRQVEVVDAIDLDDAVDIAFRWSPPGGVVLLSPAAPSFGRFADYRERSTAFAAAAARSGNR
jgi:UDP-N-acetylmuramoylalanine--D-glutamate ligase